MKVKKVSREHYTGRVYNIGTPPVHNYFANSILVHNCYQGSTVKGEHAKLNDIKRLIWKLKEAEVFEVALGGGETTQHPNFVEILKECYEHGITPNFTTFDMRWTTDQKIVEAVKKYCGGFAVSRPDVHTIAAMSEWNRNLVYDGGPRAVLQMPLGCYDMKQTRDALEVAAKLNVPVTFLGFKHVGRGEKFPVKDYSWVIDYLTESKDYQRFGADTLFVQQFKNQLLKAKVSEKLMVGVEGAFSCYIDAVEQTVGASSYVPADQMRKYNLGDYRTPCDLFADFPYAKCEVDSEKLKAENQNIAQTDVITKNCRPAWAYYD